MPSHFAIAHQADEMEQHTAEWIFREFVFHSLEFQFSNVWVELTRSSSFSLPGKQAGGFP